jgi:hypothetical protein
MEDIVSSFLTFQISLKIYHWQTLSYPRHKASDELFAAISEKIDRFVETLQGHRVQRFNFSKQYTIDLQNFSEQAGLRMLTQFEKWLQSQLPKLLIDSESDLTNLRDEMINDIHQALYLYSLH